MFLKGSLITKYKSVLLIDDYWMRVRKDGFQGISFGVMDAVVTVLGVMIGLSIHGNKLFLIIGILTAGIADSFANAAGIHVSQETEVIHTHSEVLRSTVYCFFATFITVIILTLPILFLPMPISIYVSIGIGMVLLVCLGYFVSMVNNKFKAYKLALEYLAIGACVSIICYFIGTYANLLLEGV